jgi:hypothetical protein
MRPPPATSSGAGRDLDAGDKPPLAARPQQHPRAAADKPVVINGAENSSLCGAAPIPRPNQSSPAVRGARPPSGRHRHPLTPPVSLLSRIEILRADVALCWKCDSSLGPQIGVRGTCKETPARGSAGVWRAGSRRSSLRRTAVRWRSWRTWRKAVAKVLPKAPASSARRHGLRAEHQPDALTRERKRAPPAHQAAPARGCARRRRGLEASRRSGPRRTRAARAPQANLSERGERIHSESARTGSRQPKDARRLSLIAGRTAASSSPRDSRPAFPKIGCHTMGLDPNSPARQKTPIARRGATPARSGGPVGLRLPRARRSTER